MAQQHLRYPILLSILAAIVTCGLKTVAYWLTGSVGFLSDAAESTINVVAAVTALVSLIYAARPVDESHTYGHEKIEFFSSGLEGALIFVASGFIAWFAIRRFIEPEPLEALDRGIIISLLASALNFAVARLLLRVGRRHDSIVLEADGRHLMTDVGASAAVIAGVFLVHLTNIPAFDPACALLMAGYIAWTGFDLIRRSFNGLMDRALPAEEQALIRQAIEKELEQGMTYHALRTRRAGARRFVDFHLLVPGVLQVRDAHSVGERMEAAVAQALPGTEVTVHIEPIEEQAAWEDSALLPIEQAAKAAEMGQADGKSANRS
jgi:cation diffusion facilitator family transporter